MVVISLLAALQRFTRRVSEESVTEQSQSENDDPDPNKERVETQQEEVSKATNEEPQIKKEDTAVSPLQPKENRYHLLLHLIM